VKAISTSTTLTMAKRIAPIADKHKLMVGYHGHDATNDPNQTATLESYDTLMAYGKYNGINLDIGHFTAANYDAVAFIKQHHDRITNLHLKDRKKDHGPNVAEWGTGDTPIKAVLQLLKTEKYPSPRTWSWSIGFPTARISCRGQEVLRLRKELPGVALASTDLMAFRARQDDLDRVPAVVVALVRLEGQQVAVHQVVRHLLEDWGNIAQPVHHEGPPARGARHVRELIE
jgi:hypothetical protein